VKDGTWQNPGATALVGQIHGSLDFAGSTAAGDAAKSKGEAQKVARAADAINT
jgi:hypothetical protein